MIDQHNSLGEKFLRKGFWLYLFSFIIAPLGYIIKIILSGDLEVNEIGIIYGILSLMVLLSSFNDFGLKESLNKFIPQYVTEKKYDNVKSILLYAFIIQSITGTLIFLLFFFGADYLAFYYFKDITSASVIKIFAFFFVGISIFQLLNTLFQATQDTFSQKLAEFVRMIFVLFFTLTIFFMDIGSIFYYSFAWNVGLIFGITFSIFIFIKKYYLPYLKEANILYDKKLFFEILKYGFLVFLGTQASVILSQIDMQMILILLGSYDAGYYTNYLSIIGIPMIIIGPIFALLFPVFSEMYAKKEYDKIRLVKSIFATTFLSFSIVFSFLFFVFGPQIAYILFGEKFILSGNILQWSILFLSFLFLLQINFNIFAAIGQIKTRLYIILFGLFVNIITNIIFINLYGVAGAALATGIGWIVIWGLSEYFLKDYFIKYDWKYLLKNIGIFAVISVGLWYIIEPTFEGLSRGMAFWYLGLISLLYFGMYGVVNIKDFQYFIGEVKKLRIKKQ